VSTGVRPPGLSRLMDVQVHRFALVPQMCVNSLWYSRVKPRGIAAPLQWIMIRIILYPMAKWSVLVAGICLAMLSLFAPKSSSGEPFLISDPYPKTGDQPTRFVVVAGKLRYSVPAQKLPDGRVYLRFDVSRLPDGEHTVNVTAINDRTHGESNSTPVKLVKIGQKVTLLALPEKAEPPAPPEEQQKAKISPSRMPKGLLRPPGQ